MLILGGITISIVFNEDGVISKAQEAKEKTEIAQLQERLELAKLSAYINEEYKFNLDDYFQSLEDEGIIENKEEDIVDNGDGTYEVTTDDGYIFEITVKPDKENPEEVEIEYSGKVDGPRIRKINATRVNDSTITVEVEAINAEGATYTYSYKKDGETNWVEASTGNSSNTYRFEGLDVNAGYSIKVKVEKDGKSVEKETTVAAPGAIPGGDEALTEGTITVGKEQWSNGQASIEVSTNTGLQIEYQISATLEENWETLAEGKITGLKNGDKVNIRLTNGTRYGEPVTITISDEKAPEKATITPNTTSVIIGETLTATVTHTDNESGVDITNSKWVMTESSAEIGTAEGDISKYTGSFTTNGETITLDNTKAGTYYLHVLTLDNAGNRTETVSEAITIGALAGTVTQNGDITWNAGQATLVLQSSDSNYQIVYKVNGEGDWKEYNGTSITGLNDGDTVTACLTNEGQTTYGPEATFEIKDEKAPIITEVSSNTTTNSVTLAVSAVDNEAGLPETLNYKFEIKETGAEDSSYEEIQTGANATATKGGLTQGTSYTIRVTLQDKAGNTGTYTKELTTETVGGASEGLEEGNIVASPAVWQNGQASITLSTETGLQIQYQIDGTEESSWSEGANSPVTVDNLNHGNTVYARLWDGTNAGDYSSVSITDNKVPEKAIIAPNTTSLLIGETLTATVTHTDNESGVDIENSKWVMTESSAEIGTEEGNIAQYTGSFTTNGETLTLNSNTAGTYYLHVLTVDKAGNKTETVSEVITIGALAGTVTQNGEITWNAGQATLVLQASDSNYKIVYKVNGEGSWKEYNGTSITGLNDGDKVTACLTNEGQTTYGPEATFEIKDETAPVITEVSSNTTTNSITLTVSAVDNEAGLPETLNYKFEIKETGAADNSYEEIQTGANATATKGGLKQGTRYTIRVTLQDKAGNQGTYTKELTTKTVGGASEGLEEGNIVASPAVWQNGQASITLSTTTGLQIQYQINDTEENSWSEGANSPVTVDKLSHGDTVYARLWDGTNAGDHSSVSITDNIAPTKATIAPNTTSLLIGETLTATVTHTDNESGVDIGNSKWVMTTNSEEIGTEEGNISKYTGNFTTNGETLTLDNTKAGTYYLHVLTVDNAGNKTETVSEAITISGITGTVTQSGNITWSAGQATLKLQASDSNYQIVYKVNGEESWQKYNGTSIQGLNHGDKVTACLTNEGQTTYGPEATFEIEDTTDPTVTVTALGSPGTNSIAVTVQVSDNESGMKENPTYTYYIKQSGQGDESYTTPSGASNIANAQYTFTGLTQTTSYDIKVEVNGDKAGNKGTDTLENQKTDTVPGASVGLETGNIIASPAVWQNGKASITLSTTTNYQIQYRINNTTEGSWSEAANSPITVGNLNHGDTVYARLWDGTNAGSDSSVSIEDGQVPSQAGIILSNTNVTTGTVVTATVTHTDNESGVDIGKSKYVWNTTSGKIGTSADLYTGGTFSSNGQQISQTMSSPGTYYLHVLTVDKGENAIETVSETITVRQLVTGISLNQTSATITEGETLQLTATVTPSNASNKTLRWSSNSTGVATVSTSGLVTAKTTGTATITVTTQDGSNKTATCTITVKKLATNVNELKEGDYVNYIDKNGVTRKCAVLYDSSSPYGVEIITMETVEDIELGNGTGSYQSDNSTYFNTAMNSYNNAISTLNNATSKYINSTYVDKARSVGSDPSNPTSDNPGYFTSSYSWFSNYNRKFKNTDTHYETDYNQMKALTIHDIDQNYWLASRLVNSYSSGSYFTMRYVYTGGGLSNSYLCYVDSSGSANSISNTYGLRPVFHLRSNIKVTGGTGEEGDPYTLGT